MKVLAIIEPFLGIEEANDRFLLLGLSLSVLLRQRSCVVKGTAVAFLGHSEWGKSTSAEVFYSKGYSIFSAVRTRSRKVIV